MIDESTMHVLLTLPLALRSLRCHFHNKCIAFEANAKMALPEFV
jgi:hypothetical protein